MFGEWASPLAGWQVTIMIHPWDIDQASYAQLIFGDGTRSQNLRSSSGSEWQAESLSSQPLLTSLATTGFVLGGTKWVPILNTNSEGLDYEHNALGWLNNPFINRIWLLQHQSIPQIKPALLNHNRTFEKYNCEATNDVVLEKYRVAVGLL